MSNSDIRDTIEREYRRKQKSKSIGKLKKQIKDELREEMKAERSQTEMGRFMMPRSLMLVIAVTLGMYSVVFGFAAFEAGRNDLLPYAPLILLLGFPFTFIAIYLQFFISWLTYRYFWMFTTILWLIVATGGLIYAVRMI